MGNENFLERVEKLLERHVRVRKAGRPKREQGWPCAGTEVEEK